MSNQYYPSDVLAIKNRITTAESRLADARAFIMPAEVREALKCAQIDLKVALAYLAIKPTG
jgi:hypothetical protein